MRDYIDIDTTPYDEPCSQTGASNYYKRQKIEAIVMIDYIKRLFPDCPAGISFKVKSNSHDFGSYISIQIWFDEDSEEQAEYAYSIDSNLPDKWDKQALQMLTEARYFQLNGV